MNENNEIKIKVLPLELLIPRRILNSLWRVLVIIIHVIDSRDGINQNVEGIKINPIIVLIQFSEK